MNARQKRAILLLIPFTLLVGLILLLLLRPRHDGTFPDRSPRSEGSTPAAGVQDVVHRPAVTEDDDSVVRPTVGDAIPLVLTIIAEGGESPGASNVCVNHPTLGPRYTKTDVKGVVRIELPRSLAGQNLDTYAARVNPSRLYWLRTKIAIPRNVSDEFQHTLEYPKLSEIRGAVVTEEGLPVSREPVLISVGYRAASLGGDPDNPYVIFNRLTPVAQPPQRLTLITDEQGFFVQNYVSSEIFMGFSSGLKGVNKGHVTVASTDLHSRTGSYYYQAKTPGRYSIRLIRHSAPTLMVTVLDSGMQPVKGARVVHRLEKLMLDGSFRMHGTSSETDGSGIAWIRLHLFTKETPSDLDGRRHWIAAFKEDVGIAYRASTLRSAMLRETVTLTRMNTRSIVVRVVSKTTGKPVEGARVDLTGEPFFNVSMSRKVTDREGQIIFGSFVAPDRSWDALDLKRPLFSVEPYRGGRKKAVGPEQKLIFLEIK